MAQTYKEDWSLLVYTASTCLDWSSSFWMDAQFLVMSLLCHFLHLLVAVVNGLVCIFNSLNIVL